MILRKTKFTPKGIDLIKEEGDLNCLIDSITSHVSDRETSFEIRDGDSLRFHIGIEEETQTYKISFNYEPMLNSYIEGKRFTLIEATNVAIEFFQHPASLDKNYDCLSIPSPPGAGEDIPDEHLADLYNYLRPSKKPWWKFW
jgi:hypothetical protein